MQSKIIVFPKQITKEGGVTMCKALNNVRGKSAEELLEFYGISTEPPIDLKKLLERAGISAKAMDFSEVEKAAGYNKGDILGAAISRDENLTIFYSVFDSPNRQKFTIAHELAHCCLHSESLKARHIELREKANMNDPREIDANAFAGKLLIPNESLSDIYKKLVVPSLKALSQIFQVSSNVMAARLDGLHMPYLKDTRYTNS